MATECTRLRKAYRRARLLLVGCATLAACAQEPVDQTQREAPVVLPKNVPPLKDYGGIGGAFALQDQRGETFQLAQLDGRPAMLFFGYTYCPDICPVTLSKMARVYELLDIEPRDLQTIFITVDPERDTREKLAEYLSYFQVDVIGLTGTREEIDAVVRQYGGHYALNKEDGKSEYFVDHSTYTYLIDGQGRVCFLFRHDDEPEYMAAVARQLF